MCKPFCSNANKLSKMTGNKGFEWFESHLGFFIFSLYKF